MHILLSNTVSNFISGKARVARLLSLCFFIGSGLLLAALSLQGCSEKTSSQLVMDGETMGTYYQIKVINPQGKVPAAELREVTEQALDDINNMMSTYIEGSELMRLNESPLETWIEVSAPLYSVLATSEKISQLTGGAFDITVMPLVNLWGFGPERSSSAPDEQAIQEAMARVGYQHLELHEDALKVRRNEDVQLDLSAVAKGYAADYLAQIYHDLDLHDFMIELGGDMRLSGHNAHGKPWRIGVEAPSLLPTGAVQTVVVSDVGLATSGDYRNYYEVDGKRISHTIDPRSGKSISHTLASVTVIAKTGAEADALATALNVMGAQKSRALADELGIAAYFIERENGEFVSSYSKAFEAYLQ